MFSIQIKNYRISLFVKSVSCGTYIMHALGITGVEKKKHV